MTSEAAAETYATTPAWPQESGYDSDASSVAEEPPALLSRLGTVVSPPRSLLERVGERSPAKPIPFHVSAASSEGPGESLDLNAEPSPNVTDQTMPPTDRHRSSFLVCLFTLIVIPAPDSSDYRNRVFLMFWPNLALQKFLRNSWASIPRSRQTLRPTSSKCQAFLPPATNPFSSPRLLNQISPLRATMPFPGSPPLEA